MKNRNNSNQNFKTPYNKGAKVVSPGYNNKRTREKDNTTRNADEESTGIYDNGGASEKAKVAVKINTNSFLEALLSNEKFVPLLVGIAVVLTESFIVSRKVKPNR